MSLKHDFAEYIASGLKRKSIVTCSKWAETYRILKDKRWSFDEFPWLRELHDCEAEFVIGQKAAQIGFTECALNRNFFKMDIEHIDCLYVLPTESDASDFSNGRFDPAVEESAHLKKLFSDVNNVGLKRAGNTSLYVRGSKSRSKLKSIPTGHITLDEVEEMMQENIPLAFERAAGQKNPQKFLLSTPILPKKGINKYYLDSTQKHFFFRCPHCSRLIELKFPESLVITGTHINDPDLDKSHYICYECKGVLEHEKKIEYLNTGAYVAKYPDRVMEGFTCSQLYSMRPSGKPITLARKYLRSLTDPTEDQEFHNSNLGQPRIVAESKLTEEEVEDCRRGYTKGTATSSPVVTIGIDIGKFWHYEVDEWFIDPKSNDEIINDRAICRVRDAGFINVKERGLKSIIQLILKHKASCTVIDSQPEYSAVEKIAVKLDGFVYLCRFVKSVDAKKFVISEEERVVKVNRTSWLDVSLSRFRKRTIHLPTDIDRDYIKHQTYLTRIYSRDTEGNPVGQYESDDVNDHFAFSRLYAEIALPLAVRDKRTENIGSKV